jgi:hypothetical protein
MRVLYTSNRGLAFSISYPIRLSKVIATSNQNPIGSTLVAPILAAPHVTAVLSSIRGAG